MKILSNCDRNTTQPSTSTEILTQEEEKNEQYIMKRITSEKKIALPPLRNQDWKTAKVETEKLSDLTNVPSNITELNELIYTEAKLVC